MQRLSEYCRFAAHPCDEPEMAARGIPGAQSFIEAALLYLECAPCTDEKATFVVLDRETGTTRCFCAPLASWSEAARNE